MRAPFARQIGQAVRRVCGQRRDWVVLLYHRITDLDSDPWALSVTPRHFEEQLAVLRRQTRLASLAELEASLSRGERLRRTVVVTFDDGYRDNLHEAHPILDRHRIPATIFVSTGPLTNRRGFWWDQLERALLSPGAVPRVLSLLLEGQQRRWDLGDAAAGLPPPSAQTRRWRAWEQPLTPRHACYYQLWQTLQRMTDGERWPIIDEILTWAGLPHEPGASYHTVTADDVRTLASDDLIEIGSHGVTHSAFSALRALSQRDELARSKADLEAVLGRSVTSFAYPFGRRVDYTTDTVTGVREAGFARACSATGDRPGRRVDRFEIPRVHVNDMSGGAFASWLADWLDD